MKSLKLVLFLAITFVVSVFGCNKKDSGPITNALHIMAANGTVVKNPNLPVYVKGDDVQLTATPNAGYNFTSWSGDATGTSNPLLVSMDVNKNITANFTAIAGNTFVLNVTATNGIVTKNPDQSTYPDGSTVLLTATPSPGYYFASWSGDAVGSATTLTVTVTSIKNIVANFKSLTGQVLDVKSIGAKGDGVTDDTAALQSAVEQVAGTGGTVFVPDGTYIINPITHLNLKSNMNLSMASGAVLKAKPVSSDSYAVVNLNGISNVTITGGTIQGERDQHSGTTGQWGHGFTILGSDHVTITGTTSKNCWGDGFYVGANGTTPCSVIRMTNVLADNNRRQGMSIIHANDMIIDHCTFKNTGGQAPEAGIDIEPNENNTVSNVTIQNSTISNNGRTGITLYKNHNAKWVNSFVTDITITGCIIDNNVSANLGSMSGILIDGPTAYTITNNFVRNNGHHGVYLFVTNGSTVTGNTITGNAAYGVVLASGTSNNKFTNNTIQNNTGGTLLNQGTNNTIIPNTF
jgi:uncharacterized repeat protein (TIGR02543 family)